MELTQGEPGKVNPAPSEPTHTPPQPKRRRRRWHCCNLSAAKLPWEANVGRLILVCAGLICASTPFGCTKASTSDTKLDSTKATSAHPEAPVSEVKDSAKVDRSRTLPTELLEAFRRLDSLGRSIVENAQFVDVEFLVYADSHWTKQAWRIAEDSTTLTILQDDLLPLVVPKRNETTSANGHEPVVKSVKPAEFGDLCESLSRPVNRDESEGRRADSLYAPGPSLRLLVAHAAWKKGNVSHCERIVALDPRFDASTGLAAFVKAAFEDLAWLHFLRGVNLLRYADRKEVLTNLRLSIDLDPTGRLSGQSKDLSEHLVRLIAMEALPAAVVNESQLDTTGKARLLVSQLKDISCPQFSQPGSISPYWGQSRLLRDESLPTVRLKEMDMAAIPVLIDALSDDSPTRTVYAWRDFARDRYVWRVSDFSWTLIRDISGKDFGEQRIVGFTFGYMTPDQKKSTIAEIRQWYSENANNPLDVRMLAFFESPTYEDWRTAAKYFVERQDQRAVQPLLQKIPKAMAFQSGELCELIARFGDPVVIPTIKQVLLGAEEPSDRVSAAIALWELGDESGIPVAIEFVEMTDWRYGGWEDPVWLLCRSHTEGGLESLRKIITKGPPERAGEVITHVVAAITGDLRGKSRGPAGSLELCPVLVDAMSRGDLTDRTVNGVQQRIKDLAAKAFAVLREGSGENAVGFSVEINPDVFNEFEPDSAKRDAQIAALAKWYSEQKEQLAWDQKANRLKVRQP